MTHIAFIGLGNMGRPMAANLAKAGYVVHGFDLAPFVRDGAAKEGVVIASSTVEALEGAEVTRGRTRLLKHGRKHGRSIRFGKRAGPAIRAAIIAAQSIGRRYLQRPCLTARPRVSLRKWLSSASKAIRAR